MVTLITEKLKTQAREDVPSVSLYRPQKLNQGAAWFFYDLGKRRGRGSLWTMFSQSCPMKICPKARVGLSFMEPSTCSDLSCSLAAAELPSTEPAVTSLIQELSLSDGATAGSPQTPPTKRHCRSLSVPEELSRCRSPWKPCSRVWTPVAKRRCHSGGSSSVALRVPLLPHRTAPTEFFSSPAVFTGWAPVGSCSSAFTGFGTPPESPVPRPASAASVGFVDGCTEVCSTVWLGGAPWLGLDTQNAAVNTNEVSGNGSVGSWARRLSLSQERIVDRGQLWVGGCGAGGSSTESTPEAERQAPLRLPRCRSQPCVSNGRKSGLKRRRGEDARCIRPSLDFLKMTSQTLKNSQSLCSLDDDESPRNRLETIVSPGGTCSFSAGRGDVGCITVCSSSTEEGEEVEEEDDDDDDDHDPCNEIFQLDCQGLDVDEIEKN